MCISVGLIVHTVDSAFASWEQAEQEKHHFLLTLYFSVKHSLSASSHPFPFCRCVTEEWRHYTCCYHLSPPHHEVKGFVITDKRSKRHDIRGKSPGIRRSWLLSSRRENIPIHPFNPNVSHGEMAFFCLPMHVFVLLHTPLIPTQRNHERQMMGKVHWLLPLFFLLLWWHPFLERREGRIRKKLLLYHYLCLLTAWDFSLRFLKK